MADTTQHKEENWAESKLDKAKKELDLERDPTSLTPSESLLKSTHLLHRRVLKDIELAHRVGAVTPQTLLAYERKHFSLKPLDELRLVGLDELKWRQIHHGTYLLLRIISQPTRFGGIHFVGQDPAGKAEHVEIQTTIEMLVPSGPILETLYPTGTVLAIREPYFAHSTSSCIKVESPTDIIRLSYDHSLLQNVVWKTSAITFTPPAPKTAEEFKASGNELLKKGWLLPAENAYTDGLGVDPAHVVLRLNRAQCRLQLKMFKGALDDAVCFTFPSSPKINRSLLEKAFHRSLLAAYGLQNWDCTEDVGRRYLVEFSEKQTEIQQTLDSVRRHRAERSTGVYDWKALYLRTQKTFEAGISDYCSLHLELGMSSLQKGRAAYVRQDVKAGTLLAVCQPFAAVDMEELGADHSNVVLNLHTHQTENATQAYLTRAILAKAQQDPSSWDVLQRLYAGPSYPPPPSITTHQLFLPSQSDRDEPSPSELLPHEPTLDIDISRIEAMRTYNSFGIQPLRSGLRDDSDSSDDTPASGLYILPALLNHDCLPTVHWNCWGNAMVLRASRDLKNGDELTISYCSGHDYPVRTASLKKHGIDRCGCTLCEEDRKDTDVQRARRAKGLLKLDELQKSADPENPSADLVQEFETVVEQLEATYAPDHDPFLRFELFHAYSILADLHAFNALGFSGMHTLSVKQSEAWKAAERSIGLEIKAMGACGVKLAEDWTKAERLVESGPMARESGCVGSSIAVLSLYAGMEREKEARKWARVTIELHELAFGGGVEVLLLRWADIIDSYQLEKYFR